MAGNISAAIKILLSAVDRASAPIRAVQARLSGITAAAARARLALAALGEIKGLDKLKAGLGGVLGHLKGIAGQAAGLAAPVAALFGGASIAGILGAVKATSDYADEISGAAQIAGVAVEQFQALAYAADQANVPTEVLSKSFNILNKNIAYARSGNKKAAEMFAAMGLSVDELKQLSPDEVMRKLADSFEKIENPSLKSAAAMAIFGKAGAQLLPFFEGGSKSIGEMEDKAKRLGIVMGGDGIDAVKDFGDNVSTLMQSIQGLARSIAVKVIPYLEPLVLRMTDWIAANRELIATKAGEFVEKLAGWLQRIDFDAVLQGITDFAAGVQRIVDFLGGWSNALTLLALSLTGLLGPMVSVAGGTAQIAISLTRLLPGLAAATGGFARFGLRVAALAVGLGGRLALALAGLVPALMALIPPIISVGAAILATPIGWLLAGIALIAGAVYLIINNWSALGDFFTGLWDGIKALFGGLIGWFADIGGRWIGALWGGLKSAWGGLWGWITDAVSGLVDLITAPIRAVSGLVTNTITGGGAAPMAGSAGSGGGPVVNAGGLREGTGLIPPAAGPARAQVGGEMVVRFENPPPGMTVEKSTSDTPGLTFRPDLGPAWGIA
ncbi:hypothetical protein GCM10011497_06520 [Elstera cyanobacteriorum]|uniref:Phage tail tape measure protein domain-containing protein n=1 Tax=Elstera cyanobacteriorum TaxID=2022747 RepID=A0A255XTB8_9PROT|nr:hypothetical protein [Elstera cyanobacteriorum]OYQ20236.1 hypothetical protein CHR90_05875 [Elstera cyanobacteriorum]GFZ80746.1 hypothetical protein GCM10011497_06520 [Elstera cyanobacteriorum]